MSHGKTIDDTWNLISSGPTLAFVLGYIVKTIVDYLTGGKAKRNEISDKAEADKKQKEFELAHPDRVTAAKEVFRLCNELKDGTSQLCIIRCFMANGKNQGFIENLKEAGFSILGKLSAPCQYIASHPYEIGDNLEAAVNDFTSCVAAIIANESQDSMAVFSKDNDIMKAKLKVIGDVIQKLIGG